MQNQNTFFRSIISSVNFIEICVSKYLLIGFLINIEINIENRKSPVRVSPSIFRILHIMSKNSINIVRNRIEN